MTANLSVASGLLLKHQHHQPCAPISCMILQVQEHLVMLAAGGLITIGEFHSATGLLHAKWADSSPAHRHMWDTVGADILQNFLHKLPDAYNMVHPHLAAHASCSCCP